MTQEVLQDAHDQQYSTDALLTQITTAIDTNDEGEINKLFIQAKAVKNWEAVKLFCGMPEATFKPRGATKENIIYEIKNTGTPCVDIIQDLLDIEMAFKEGEPYQIEAGPLLRVTATEDLEAFIRKLMSPDGGQFTLIQNDVGDDIFQFIDNEFNWTQILRNANPQHVLLKKEDLELYSAYSETIPDGSPYAPSYCSPAYVTDDGGEYVQDADGNFLTENREVGLTPEAYEAYKTKLYQAIKYDDVTEIGYDPEKPVTDVIPSELPPLSFPEMVAINVYSRMGSPMPYVEMNGIWRGTIGGDTGWEATRSSWEEAPGEKYRVTNENIRAAIVNSVFCTSGLGKIPELPFLPKVDTTQAVSMVSSTSIPSNEMTDDEIVSTSASESTGSIASTTLTNSIELTESITEGMTEISDEEPYLNEVYRTLTLSIDDITDLAKAVANEEVRTYNGLMSTAVLRSMAVSFGDQLKDPDKAKVLFKLQNPMGFYIAPISSSLTYDGPVWEASTDSKKHEYYRCLEHEFLMPLTNQVQWHSCEYDADIGMFVFSGSIVRDINLAPVDQAQHPLTATTSNGSLDPEGVEVASALLDDMNLEANPTNEEVTITTGGSVDKFKDFKNKLKNEIELCQDLEPEGDVNKFSNK